MSVAEARAMLERHGLAAHRSRGQNFLHDEALAAKLVRTAGVGAEDGVLEIGTGLGILTRALAEAAANVVTVEIDGGLVRALEAERVLPGNVRLVHADALALDLENEVAQLGPSVRVVANLPYAVATPLLRRFLELIPGLRGFGVMVQKEVAGRICAAEGERGYGSLAVLHHWLVRRVGALDLHPRCFYPVPKVVSTFLAMEPVEPAPWAQDELAQGLARAERLLRGGFGHRRKTLANALRQSVGLAPAEVEGWLEARGLPRRARAENLTPDTWLALDRAFGEAAT